MTHMSPWPLAFDPREYFERIPVEVRPWVILGAAAVLMLIILRLLWSALWRRIRRSRSPTIHPNLQKYNVDHAELDRRRRKSAQAIVATSTGARLAGYHIVRQVEAVFVEGFRTPDDAMIALKADAADRGANAIVNVRTDRTAAGKCTASGDAIIVAPLTPRPDPRAKSPPAGKSD